MWELELIPIYLLLAMGGSNVCIQLQNLFCILQEVLFFTNAFYAFNEPTLK